MSGDCAGLRDAEHERVDVARRLVVERVQRRRGERDRHARQAPEQVLRVAGGVVGGAAGGDHGVARAAAGDLARGGRDRAALLGEQALEHLGLLGDLRPSERQRLPSLTRTRSTWSRSSRITTSAGAPTAMRPRSGRPATRAGTVEAAASASSQRDAELVQVAHRLDHRQRAAAELALRAAHHAVLGPQRPRAEPVLAVAHRRAAGTASVTSAKRPAAACQATRTVSGATWWWSTITCTTTSGARERGHGDARGRARCSGASR